MMRVFGATPSKEQQERFLQLEHYRDGRFVNLVPTKMRMGAADALSMLKDFFIGAKDRRPAGKLPVAAIDWDLIRREEDSLTWFGHSSFLLGMDNLKLLVDPMLGPVASPVSFAGSKRYSEDLLHLVDEMPPIDAVFITHDHFDHLDYPSILRLKGKVDRYFVPCGVGAHLVRWGVERDRITEMNWWEETAFRGLTVALTPSKHFSGRGLGRDRSLWGGWVILGQRTRFYTSGDGGYDAHFQAIGDKYGPFDLALIEGGQYDRRWPWVHMTPEESVKANVDVRGKHMMLVHWGAFSLAFHGWTDPIDRALAAGERAGVHLLAPRIGETVVLNEALSADVAVSPWWRLPG